MVRPWHGAFKEYVSNVYHSCLPIQEGIFSQHYETDICFNSCKVVANTRALHPVIMQIAPSIFTLQTELFVVRQN